MEQQSPGEEGRRCPYCPRTFPFPSYLQRHLTLHTGEKPFRCPRCGQRYTRRNYLADHIKRKHTGELPAAPAIPQQPAPARYLYPCLRQPAPIRRPPHAASPPRAALMQGAGGLEAALTSTPAYTPLANEEEDS